MPLVLELLSEETIKQSRTLFDELATALDIYGNNPVHYAAFRLDDKCLEVFIKHKVDVTGVTTHNETIITIIGNQVEKAESEIQKEKFKAIFHLLVKNTLINRKLAIMRSTIEKQNYPLHFAVAYAERKDVETLGKLFNIQTLSYFFWF